MDGKNNGEEYIYILTLHSGLSSTDGKRSNSILETAMILRLCEACP